MTWLPRLGNDDEDLVDMRQLEFVERALSQPLEPGRDILAIAIPAPGEAAEKFLRLVPRDMGFLWRSPSGVRIAGGGSTFAIHASGPNRFNQLRDAAAAFWPRVTMRSAIPVPPIALVGGAAFLPGAPDVEPWSEFAADAFSLPRWSFRRTTTGAVLTLTVLDTELAKPGAAAALLAETRSLLVGLERESATSLIERPEIARSALHHLSLSDWNSYMDAIQAALASGQFEKIVAARRCVVDLPKRLDDTGFMARLFASYPDCTQFAFRRARATFLGATPETLFRKAGNQLVTHALAGTTRVKDEPNVDASTESAELSRSYKNLSEHALVVKKICDELWPLASRIRYSASPHVRKVRHLVHLQTPISADLREGVDVFDLIQALHPTPAVGGFPAKEAAIWLRDNEPLERGWYTGTVGWFDEAGNSEFAVAIRCGVLTESRAYIYAGAGIVRESDSESEYNETAAKMVPILRALGVSI